MFNEHLLCQTLYWNYAVQSLLKPFRVGPFYYPHVIDKKEEAKFK